MRLNPGELVQTQIAGPTPNVREVTLLASSRVLLLVVVQCPETTFAEPLAQFSPVLRLPAFTHPVGTVDKKCPRPSAYPAKWGLS